jgi:hypothetical protein
MNDAQDLEASNQLPDMRSRPALKRKVVMSELGPEELNFVLVARLFPLFSHPPVALRTTVADRSFPRATPLMQLC